MFSIFYRMTETKIPDNVRVIVFKPNKKNQWAIIKGQLGQYKLKLHSTIKLLGEYQDKYIRERDTQSQRETSSLPISNSTPSTFYSQPKTREPLNLYGVKTILQYNVDTNKFLGYYKTHFVYEQTPQGSHVTTTKKNDSSSNTTSCGLWRKKLKDVPFLSYNYETPVLDTRTISRGEEMPLERGTWPKSLLKANKNTFEKKKDTYKLFIGYLISSPYNGNSTSVIRAESERPSSLNVVSEKIAPSLGKDEKDKKTVTELKKIFTGVSQGYTMNLELKGIGYSSSIRSVNATQSFDKLAQNLPSKHDLFTSYGKFELFFSCEEKHAGQNSTEFEEEKENETKEPTSKKTTKSKTKRSNYTKLLKIKACKNIKGEKNDHLQETYKKPTKRQVLDLSIGLSHNVVYTIPENHVSINCTTSNVQSNVTNTVTIFGISNAIVNQIAANIYNFKKPEPYKGKGIRYDGEKLFMKPEKKK